MNSWRFTSYEIYEINELSLCHRTDVGRLGRGILMVGVPSGPIPGWGSGGLSQNMTIPRQLALGEVIGQKKGKAEPKPRPVFSRSSKARSGRRTA